jgi:4-aminobutyrate aminotransferase-like enzyme
MPTDRNRRLLATGLTHGSSGAPLVVGGSGVWFHLDDGRRVIDASNTACPLGHGHPEVVDAIRRAATAPVVNEGMRWAEREEAAEELLGTAFADEPWVGAVRFFISAGEANDVALALCQALTGRSPLATRERAYHGGVGLARELTVQPQWHGGLSSATDGVLAPPRLAEVRELPAPVGARIGGESQASEAAPSLEGAESILTDCAAVLLDYSQGGIYHSPSYQDEVARLARTAGTFWIADETVTGFGRVGGWFQFQHAESRPDLVTMGKPLSAGGAAAGAVVFSESVLDEISSGSWQTYSTFRAHPVEVAAIRAHLRVSAREGLINRATALDGFMFEGFLELARAHPSVSRIDGRGLHWTVELRGPDWRTWRGEESEPLASRVAARALEADVLVATSGEQTSLFIAPPLIVSEDELRKILEALDQGLMVADRELEQVVT